MSKKALACFLGLILMVLGFLLALRPCLLLAVFVFFLRRGS